ncbi:MAG: DUF615 domain-containing protein, partial [Desulfovibrionaceae bacterium]
FQRIEGWRDRLLEGDDALLDDLGGRFPEERQRLRQLVLGARRERAGDKPPRQFRELFRLLRELAAGEKPASPALDETD